MIRISCCIRQRQVYCHPKIFDRGLFDGLIFVDTYSAWSEKQDSEVADKVNGSVAHYWFPCLKQNLSRATLIWTMMMNLFVGNLALNVKWIFFLVIFSYIYLFVHI